MADVKWIKIVTDIFDNRKIRQIETMPEGDSILIIWFKLICLAGSINDNGMVYFTQDIPYTEDMLATHFNRPLGTVKLALATFERFGMVEIVDNFLCLPSWEKYQSTDKLERIKSQNAERQARFRARKRAELPESNVTPALPVTPTVTPSNAVDIDKDIDRDIEEEKNNILPGAETPPDLPDPLSATVISIILNDKSEYPITEKDIEVWSDLYPAVDVLQELRKMKGWADANPTKRKTKAGIKRFINSWLSKEQDRYHGPAGGLQTPPVRGTSYGDSGFETSNPFRELLDERRKM